MELIYDPLIANSSLFALSFFQTPAMFNVLSNTTKSFKHIWQWFSYLGDARNSRMCKTLKSNQPFLSYQLKVRKSQKNFFLSSNTPKNQRNFLQISVLASKKPQKVVGTKRYKHRNTNLIQITNIIKCISFFWFDHF